MEELNEKTLLRQRDHLLASIWLVMREISDRMEMSDDDMDLWVTISDHSAIREMLRKGRG